MTSPKPITRQQIVDVLRKHRSAPNKAPFMYEAEAIVDVLVKEGLAEEPSLPRGMYSVMWTNHPSQCAADAYWDGKYWYDQTAMKPHRVIQPPEDK